MSGGCTVHSWPTMASSTVAEPTSSDETKELTEKPDPTADDGKTEASEKYDNKDDDKDKNAAKTEDECSQNFGGYLLKIISDIIFDLSGDEDDEKTLEKKVTSSKCKSAAFDGDTEESDDEHGKDVTKAHKRKSSMTGIFNLTETDSEGGHVAPKKRFLAGFSPGGSSKPGDNVGKGKKLSSSSEGMIYHMRNCIDTIVDSRYIQECIRCEDDGPKGESILEKASNESVLKPNTDTNDIIVTASDLIPKAPGAPLTEMAAMACRVPRGSHYLAKKHVEVIDLDGDSNEKSEKSSLSTGQAPQKSGNDVVPVPTSASPIPNPAKKYGAEYQRPCLRGRPPALKDAVRNQHFPNNMPPPMSGRPMPGPTMVNTPYPGHMHTVQGTANRSHMVESHTLASHPMERGSAMNAMAKTNHTEVHPQTHGSSHPLQGAQPRWPYHEERPGYPSKDHHMALGVRPTGLPTSHAHIQGVSASSQVSYHSPQTGLSANLLQQGSAPSLPIMIAEMARHQRQMGMTNPAPRIPCDVFPRHPGAYSWSDPKIGMMAQEAAANGMRYTEGPSSQLPPQTSSQVSPGGSSTPGYFHYNQRNESPNPDAYENASCCPSDCPHSAQASDDPSRSCSACSEMGCLAKGPREAPLDLTNKPDGDEAPLDLSVQKTDGKVLARIKKEPVDCDCPPVMPEKNGINPGAGYHGETHRPRMYMSTTATHRFESPFNAAKHPTAAQVSMMQPRLPSQMPPPLPQAMPRPMHPPVQRPLPPGLISHGVLPGHLHRQPQIPIHIQNHNPMLKPNVPLNAAAAWSVADTRMRGAALMTSQWMQAGMNPQPYDQMPPMQQPPPTKYKGGMNLIGSHSPCDILYLKCNLCHQTYGNLHNFRKHFLKSHGFDPSPNDVVVHTISATKEAESSEHRVQHAQYASHRANDTLQNGLTKLPTIPTNESEYLSGSAKNSIYTNSESSLPGQNMQCVQCGLQFPTRDWGAFRRHMRIHEAPGLYCPFCQQPARDEESLAQHKSVCATIRKSCPHCRAVFAHGAALTTHLRESHGLCPSSRPLVCPYCAQYFQSPKQLTVHVREHEKSIGLLTNTPDDSHTPVSRASPDSTNDIDSQKKDDTSKLTRHNVNKGKGDKSLSLLDIVKQKIEEASNKLLDKCEEFPITAHSATHSKASTAPFIVASKLPMPSDVEVSEQNFSTQHIPGRETERPTTPPSCNTSIVKDKTKQSSPILTLDNIKDTHSVEQALNWIVEKALMETLISDKTEDSAVPVFSVLSKLQDLGKKDKLDKTDEIIVIDPPEEEQDDKLRESPPEVNQAVQSTDLTKEKCESHDDDDNLRVCHEHDKATASSNLTPRIGTDTHNGDHQEANGSCLSPHSGNKRKASSCDSDLGDNKLECEGSGPRDPGVPRTDADLPMPRLEAQSPQPEVLPVSATEPPKLTLEINRDAKKPQADNLTKPDCEDSEGGSSTSTPLTPRSSTPGSASAPTTPGGGPCSLSPSPRLYGKKRWVAAHQEETFATKRRRESTDN